MSENKRLEDMTNEQLWELFPIKLTSHKDYWFDWYLEEEKEITKILDKDNINRISHIGSTAIKNIFAKPIIDILIEVRNITELNIIKEKLQLNNYICMSEDKNRISLNKGYTINGFADKVFHIHLRLLGDNDELYFRDYLNKYENIAKEYEKLKLNLWKEYEYNRDMYTEMKTDFIFVNTVKAKKEIGLIYS
ncbi:GrpB family protein [Miniphocaeibacter massiliensis]|uniref:GrpB family protein n=1 Tax=Miniphocaeibacter massiliensis TaxID=2041841 RepID=UPI000C06D745|nr:GrpB family protein [Miniphocaeibacter massiliensis]